MSHDVWADVVPFVAHGVITLEHYDNPEEAGPEKLKLISAEMYVEGDWTTDEEVYKSLSIDNVTQGGWRYEPYTTLKACQIGKNNKLYGNVWVKDDLRVVLVNESEYSNVGEYYIAACSNRRQDLREFLRDMNINRPIEETDSVMQSG